MKLTMLLIAAPLVGGYALAEPKSFGDGSLPDYLATYDVDGNGVIDEEERQAIREARKTAREERRREIDTDGDGVISDAEREAMRQAILERIQAKRAEHFATIAGEDGLLTLEEFAALPHFANVDPARVEAIFNHLDTDGSGDVTLEEFTARLRRHRDGDGDHNGDPVDRDGPAERFAAIAGEDGLLSLEEFMALPHPEGATEAQLAARFEALDTDDSGFLTLEEFFGGVAPGGPEGPGGRR